MFMFEISEPLGWVKPYLLLLLLGFCFGIPGNLGKDMQFEIPLKDQIVLCYFSLLKLVPPNLPRCSVYLKKKKKMEIFHQGTCPLLLLK